MKYLLTLFILVTTLCQADDQWDQLVRMQQQQLLIQSVRNASDIWNGGSQTYQQPIQRQDVQCVTRARTNIYGNVVLYTDCN